MSDPPDALEASYAFCRRAARQARSSFYPSFLLLKGARRRAMEALYAFMRLTDDLADRPGPTALRHEALAVWRQELAAALTSQAGAPLVAPPPPAAPSDRSQGPLPHLAASTPKPASPALALPAVVDTVRRFRIPVEHLFAVIEGVGMDLEGRRYRTFAELADYCHCVASAVGLACIHIWGFRGEGALEPARRCGLALQLTNILRDLKEDAAQGRVYLPLEEIESCGYSIEELTGGVANESFDRLMVRQIERAREQYRAGAALFDWLEPPGRRIFGMMLGTYWRLLGAIARQPRRVLVRRARLSAWQKLCLAARWTFLPARRSALP